MTKATALQHVLFVATIMVVTASSTLAFQVSLPGQYSTTPVQRRTPGPTFPPSTLLLAGFDLDEIESQAQEAAENWGISVTPFLSDVDAKLVEERLSSRADLGYVRVGGLSDFSRSRFVLSNPDLGLEAATAEEEHCVVLCVDNLSMAQPWPHVLTRIGVDLENVGDVVVEGDTVYLVVAPEVAKQCSRLLPKELKGTGVTVSTLEPGDYLPYDGELQDMELGRLDKRALKYKQK
jgi:hypothetical protein